MYTRLLTNSTLFITAVISAHDQTFSLVKLFRLKDLNPEPAMCSVLDITHSKRQLTEIKKHNKKTNFVKL